jgi:putative exosortase-associated protein (TIGR04073 family)
LLFTTFAVPVGLMKTKFDMRKLISSASGAVAVAFLATGCAGPEQKFGRGLNNVTEFARMGEIRRSMEQTALWDGNGEAYTTGFIRGFNRSLARTGVGLFEILTFPIPTPNYDPIFLPASPVYPDSYTPGILADPTFGPDAAIGFSGGDIAPMIPGSRFHVYDY